MKFKPGATTGKEFEDKIDLWLNNANITFYSDKTLSNGKRRQKDIKCDRRLIIDDIEVFIELKTTTEKQALDYSLYDDGRTHKIKFHQICKMDWLIVEFRPNKPIAITKDNFLFFAATHKKNSINYKNALEIGFEIEDFLWILQK
jgi:hypothetical protein